MMKKMVSCALLLLLFVTIALPVFAAFDNPPIVDNAGYLSQTEFAELSEALEQVRDKYDFEVAIYTEWDLSAGSAQAAADDIYDYNGYGAGENDDGILFYIARNQRQYHFTTYADGSRVFNDDGLIYLEGKVLPYLKNDDYYGACKAYIQTADELLEMANEGTPYHEAERDWGYIFTVVALCLGIPPVIALVAMGLQLRKMKTAVKNDYAVNYMKPGSFQVTESRDLFLYSTITKTERPKEDSDSGHSTMHTSSSGRSHGGRGGGF